MSTDAMAVRFDQVDQRLSSHEERLADHDARLRDISQAQAAANVQLGTLRDDVREVVQELKDTNKRVDKRIGDLIRAAWSLVLVLIPIAVALIRGVS